MSDWNELLVFVKVVQEGSFTAAARKLGLPKSTVSRRISALEGRLGLRLLQRTTRRLSLTEVGRGFFERCERIASDVEEAELSVAQLLDAPRGMLRMTAPVEFGVALSSLVGEYVTRHPEVRVDVLLTDRVVDLIDSGVDVALRAGPLSDSSLIARKLTSAKRVLCASPSYLERCGSPAEPAGLQEHDCVSFRAGSETEVWRLEGPRDQISVRIAPRLVVNNYEFAREAVLAGLGIGMLPTFRCAEDIRAGRLVQVLEPWSSTEIEVHVLYASARHLSPKVRAFVDLLVTRSAPLPWSLS